MKRRALFLLVVMVAAVLLASGVGLAESQPSQQQTSSDQKAQTVKVMTRNVYHGVDAELDAAASAQSADAFQQAASAVYKSYHDRRFLEERAAALAAEIEETQPDVIGLQELVKVRTGPLDGIPYRVPGTKPNAETPDLDYLQMLLDELKKRGLNYAVAEEGGQGLFNWDIEVPTASGFDLRHTYRVATLVRTNGGLKVSGTESSHFNENCPLPTLIGPTVVTRGWTAVDAQIQGKEIRFINTHLDGDCPRFRPAPDIGYSKQIAQAEEILEGPVADAKEKGIPVVLLGDLNSLASLPDDTRAESETYRQLLKAGFSDAWIAGGSGAGLTCCQDDKLDNPASKLGDRRDYVLFQGQFEVTDAELVGSKPADRTPPVYWASDHAGVVAKLGLPQS